jgi:hypothetical protein
MKIKKSKTIGIILFIISIILILFISFTGYFLDDFHLNPFLGLNLAVSVPFRKEINLNNEKFGFSKIIYNISDEGNSTGISVDIFSNDKLLLTVGGDENTFIGFKDINNDGYKDILVKSLSHWSKQGLWVFKNDSFVKSKLNIKSKFIIYLATILLYSKLLLILIVIIILIGLSCYFSNSKITVIGVGEQRVPDDEN